MVPRLRGPPLSKHTPFSMKWVNNKNASPELLLSCNRVQTDLAAQIPHLPLVHLVSAASPTPAPSLHLVKRGAWPTFLYTSLGQQCTYPAPFCIFRLYVADSLRTMELWFTSSQRMRSLRSQWSSLDHTKHCYRSFQYLFLCLDTERKDAASFW